MISIFTPRYAHPTIGKQERVALSIADMLDDPTENPMPTTCGDCSIEGTPTNPLMMKPYFLMRSGLPRGTYYQARCTRCQEDRVAKRMAI